jgi:hypothetical protein
MGLCDHDLVAAVEIRANDLPAIVAVRLVPVELAIVNNDAPDAPPVSK